MKKKLLAVVLALALVLGLGATAIAATGDVDLTVHFRDIVVTRDGEKIDLKDEQGNVLEPFLYNASTYLPVRAIAEATGAEVKWDGATNTVSIDYPEQDPVYIYVPVEIEVPVEPEAPVLPENEFLVDPAEALTYINPLPLPEIPLSGNGLNPGQISDDPFFIGTMIANEGIPNGEASTHMRFQTLFRGTGTYISEQTCRSTADPYGLYYNDTWYIYGTGGALWVSEDFANWRFVDLKKYTVDAETGEPSELKDLGFTAPSVTVYTDKDGKDWFYLASNGSNLFRAESPEGPFEDLGGFTWQGKSLSSYAQNDGIPSNSDVCPFADDDGRMYFYWGMGPGVWGAEVDPENPTVLITEPVQIIDFNKNVYWERFGQHNQDYENGFPEGAQMVKIDGTYYLTWASAGTQYDSYAQGAYKSTEGPLSGYVPQERPITNTDDIVEGTVRGGGHGSVVVGPNGTIWNFYTVNIGYEGDMERRIGCDPVGIDENGDLYVPTHSENPQYVPGVLSHPEQGNETGAVELTARQGYHISSYSEGRHPVYATDDSVLTWWQPEEGDEEPFYLVSFKGNYYVQDFRILWKEIGLATGEGETAAPFQYKIEVFYGTSNPLKPAEGDEWVTVVDKTGNTEDLIGDYIHLDEPVLANFARLTITGWAEGTTPGVVEFAAFGESIAKYE